MLPFLFITSPELSTVRGKEKNREKCFGLQLMHRENGLLQICTWGDSLLKTTAVSSKLLSDKGNPQEGR